MHVPGLSDARLMAWLRRVRVAVLPVLVLGGATSHAVEGRSFQQRQPPASHAEERVLLLTAVVHWSGALARGDALSSRRLGAGRFEVVFRQDVSGCSYRAGLGVKPGASRMRKGSVAASQRLGLPQALFVETFDASGRSAPRTFHLQVSCPDTAADRASNVRHGPPLQPGTEW